ncbi:MAG: hypothetical protein IJ123_06845 [Blautia sp.]|nr:hypothetical protein [Blautia sp.]
MDFAEKIKTKTGMIDEDRWRDNYIIVLSAILLSVLTSILFYMQTLNIEGSYGSDLPSHISYALTQDNYSIVFLLIKWIYTGTHYLNYSIGLLDGLTVGAAFLCTTFTVRRLFPLSKWTSMAIAFGLLMLTHIYIPVLFPRYYMGSLLSQPWHNITYNFMRPFAVLTMCAFARLHEIYKNEKRISWKYWICTCICLVLSTVVKPNFLMGFAPALLVFLLIDFFGKRNTFKNEFILGTVVLPAAAVLPIQALLLFNEENGIIFAPSIFFFSEGMLIFLMKFLTALPFPVMVYIYNRRRLINGAGIAAWGYFWAVMEGMFIMESGMRMTHGNFMWGVEIMGYILFMYCVPMFIRDFNEYRSGGAGRTAVRRAYIICGFILMACHLMTGLVYFIKICHGEWYYI